MAYSVAGESETIKFWLCYRCIPDGQWRFYRR